MNRTCRPNLVSKVCGFLTSSVLCFSAIYVSAELAEVGWGYDYYGQTDAPPGLSNVIAIAAGYYHSLALKSNGTVVAKLW